VPESRRSATLPRWPVSLPPFRDRVAAIIDGPMETTSAPGPGPGSSTPPDDEVRGLRDQARRLREAALALLRAHVELARAEFSEIADELKSLLGLIGLAVAAAFWAALLLLVGLPLFLGEWLFGSIAWGILHGLLALAVLAVAAVLLALGAPGRVVWRGGAAGVVVGLAIALGLGSNVSRDGATALARWGTETYGWALPAGWEHVVVGVGVGALLGLLLGLVVAIWRRPGAGAAVGAVILAVLALALVAWFAGGIAFSWRGAGAIGLTAGLVGWLAAMGLAAPGSVDPEKRMRRLYPRTTIETARETMAWVRALIRPGGR